ncbi:glycosyltransferase family 2 protein [uncultured Microbacterium sp.]|uniref:glycosyltransferase family 2 protein n=1 Tax=uncultured Microbacterium sp. TaxID=191216 RepID=UPI0025FBC3AC|nr:glycosyltransferase family 2 protein [uncultured Microbacterium sp.]
MSQLLPITVLIQTKNEELGIAACIEGVREFSEIIVVDSLSTDKTKAIAEELGATVVDFKWDGAYPKKKQWQIENIRTQNPWILFMDADETPTVELIAELRNIFALGQPAPSEVAFDIDLDYVFAGTVLKHGHRVTKRCLARIDSVEFPVVDDIGIPGMGELEGHYQPVARGPVGRLRGRILHNDLDPVSTWFARHNKYSDWEAHLRARTTARKEVRDLRTMKGRIFDLVPFKPLAFFFYAYIARTGFMDGRAGLDYAIALSTYYWQIGLKTRELNRSRGDIA